MTKEEDWESQKTVVTSHYSNSRSKWRFLRLVLQAQARLIKATPNQENILAPGTDCRDLEVVTIIDTPTSTEVTLDVGFPSDDNIHNNNSHDDNDQLHTQYKNINIIIRQNDLNSLLALGGAPALAEVFGTDLETGLPRDDNHHCFRQITPKPSSFQAPEKDLIRRLLGSSNNYIIFLLVISGILSIGFGIKEEGPRTGWFEGFVILLAAVILVSLPLIYDLMGLPKKHDDTVEGNETMVEAIRGGNKVSISMSNLLLGDIVCLKRGSRIPGDGLFVSGESLQLDDRSNSEAVINASDNPFLLFGPEVRNGEGNMLVTAVGENTKWAEAMTSITPLNRVVPFATQLDKLNTCKQIVGIAISISMVVIMFLRFEFARDRAKSSGISDVKGKPKAVEELNGIVERIVLKPNGKISTSMTSLTMLLVGVVEGFPFIIAVAVAYWRRIKGWAFAQKLSACVAMGSATVICTDLLGGLTLKPLQVSKYWIGEQEMTEDSIIEPRVSDALCQGIAASLLLPQPLDTEADEPLLSWAVSKFCLELKNVRQCNTIFGVDKLIGSEGIRGLLIRKNDNTMHLHYRGLPTTILPMCSHYYNCKGLQINMDEQKAIGFQKIVERMQRSEQQVIAFAYKQTDTPTFDATKLILLGLVGLRTQVREEIKDSISACLHAGVKIIVVSNEDVGKLDSVAREFGIISQETDHIIKGEEFRKLKDEERVRMATRISVMGNCVPSDKIQLIESLKRIEDIVCVIGKSTNDALALKTADVGVVMGCWSTSAARASADIVLWGTNIGSLVPVLWYGRCINSNIRNYLKLELTMLVAGSFIGFVSVAWTGNMPITTIESCWVNLVVPMLGGLALLTEQRPLESLPNPSRGKWEGVITKAMWASIVSQSIYQGVILLAFQFKLRSMFALGEKVGKTIMFNSFVICHVFNQALVIRNKYRFWLVLGVIVVLQAIFIEIAHAIAGNAKLNLVQWGICFVIGTVPLLIDLVQKLIIGFIMG